MKMKPKNHFLAFDLDTHLGKFIAFIRMAEGMSELDARTDARALLHCVFGGNRGIYAGRVVGDGTPVTEVPLEAWQEANNGWLLMKAEK